MIGLINFVIGPRKMDRKTLLIIIAIIVSVAAEESEQGQDSSQDSITTQPQHDDVTISIHFH